VQESYVLSTYSLYQNYPNPFNPSTTIEFTLHKSEYVELKVYNTLGQEVQVLLNERKHAGHHKVEFNGRNLPSGVYFYKIEAGEYKQVRKSILLK
jgi:hypothetical protein